MRLFKSIETLGIPYLREMTLNLKILCCRKDFFLNFLFKF